MNSNTNDSHKERSILAHLDVNQVAELVCTSYNLTLDDDCNIVLNCSTGEKLVYTNGFDDGFDDLLPISDGEQIDRNEDLAYNWCWLEALITMVRLKLMAKRGENSQYIIKKYNETM